MPDDYENLGNKYGEHVVDVKSMVDQTSAEFDMMFKRNGFAAKGLTQEFDAICKKVSAETLSGIDDPVLRAGVEERIAQQDLRRRSAIEEYEANQVYKAANEQIGVNVGIQTQEAFKDIFLAQLNENTRFDEEGKRLKATMDDAIKTLDSNINAKDEEGYKLARKKIEDAYRRDSETNQFQHDNFAKSYVALAKKQFSEIHLKAFKDSLSLGMSSEAAYARASKLVSAGYGDFIDAVANAETKNGDFRMSTALVEDLEREDCGLKWIPKKDKDGKVIVREDGSVEREYVSGQYDPADNVWMSRDDVLKRRVFLDGAIRRFNSENSLKNAQNELASCGRLGALMNQGRDMFAMGTKPDGTLDMTDKFDPKAYREIVMQMQEILENPPSKEIASRANAYLNRMSELFDQRSRRFTQVRNRVRMDSEKQIKVDSIDAKSKTQVEYDTLIAKAKRARAAGEMVDVELVDDNGKKFVKQFDADSAIKFYYDCGVSLGLKMNRADYTEAVANLDENAGAYYSKLLSDVGIYIPLRQVNSYGDNYFAVTDAYPGVKNLDSPQWWNPSDDNDRTDFPITPRITNGRVVIPNDNVKDYFRFAWQRPDGESVSIQKAGVVRILNKIHAMRSRGISPASEDFKTMLTNALNSEAVKTAKEDVSAAIVSSLTEQYNMNRAGEVTGQDAGYLMPLTKTQWTKDMAARLRGAEANLNNYDPNTDEDIKDDTED